MQLTEADVLIPQAGSTGGDTEPKIAEPIQDYGRMLDEKSAEIISKFVRENQDPALVVQIHEKVSEILTHDEHIDYIAVQHKPLVNFHPDAVALTNRRLIIYRPKAFGRVDFVDFIWRDMHDAHLKEGILGSTLAFRLVGGSSVQVDHLPKAQARRLYAHAQQIEERVREERRVRELEEARAAAGGVLIASGPGNPMSVSEQAVEDPVVKLKQLKELLDAGLISPGEYETKRQSVLSRF